MKIIKWIRFCLYVVLGVLVFIFHEFVLEHLNYTVGGIMIFFGLESAFEIMIHKQLLKNPIIYFNEIMVFLLGVILLFLPGNEHFVTVCVVWSVWSILREGWEVGEKVVSKELHWPIAIINLTESIVVIVLSIMLIFNPTEHHALVHVYLLGIELLLEVLFPIINTIYEKITKKEVTNE